MNNIKNQRQYAFDIVCALLMRQYKKSLLGNQCAYRGEHGTMCAIGAFIPDGHHLSAWVAKSVLCDLISCITGLTELELTELIYTHDKYDPNDWHARLAHFAANGHLSTATLDRYARRYGRIAA